MSCSLCGSDSSREILRKGPVPVWTDVSDEESTGAVYPCILVQCDSCGHVYQPINEELRQLFAEIYSSNVAQGPSPMGAGNWGMQRAQRLFFDHIDLGTHRTAAEIGCGDGYLLKALRARGFERLVGIEPSVNVEQAAIDGITFLNTYVDGALRLTEKVDLIYSIAVFEHIEPINDVLAFCRNNLNPAGDLFFVVPNAEQQLSSGDPALFVHQHVHYFTAHSLEFLLARNGFEPVAIDARGDAFHVQARLSGSLSASASNVTSYNSYQGDLERVLDRLREQLASGAVIVHGACNALNNISAWIGGNYQLADNDMNKQGRTYFHKVVVAPHALDLGAYRTLVIVPTAFFAPIRDDYVRRGFAGQIVGVTL